MKKSLRNKDEKIKIKSPFMKGKWEGLTQENTGVGPQWFLQCFASFIKLNNKYQGILDNKGISFVAVVFLRGCHLMLL